MMNIDPLAIDPGLEQHLFDRHTEIKSIDDLMSQRGTPVPALMSIFFKFIKNPSTVSVDTFKRMVDTDDTVGSSVDLLATLLAARLGTYQHPSDEITAWVNKAFTMVDGGMYEAVKEIISAVWAGYSVNEQVWANTDHGFIVERLAPLPPGTLFFEVDRVGKLTKDGILQYQRAMSPSMIGGAGIYGNGFSGAFPGLRPDPFAKLGDLPYPLRTGNQVNYMSIRIPPQKCIHFAFNAQGKFGSPYGRSLLRRGYNHWIMKNAFLQMLVTALDRKGTPIIVVFADPNATIIDQDKVQSGQNVRGNPNIGIRAEAAALRAFSDLHNDSVIVLPGKKDQAYSIETVDVTANVSDFLSAISNCDKGLMRALMVPTLIFGNGDGSGSFSLGQEHARTFEKILDGMNMGLMQVLIDQHVRRLIMYNFPETAWRKDGFGTFSKRDFSQDEINQILEAYDRMQAMGAIDMTDLEDLNKVRETGGFSPRTEIPDIYKAARENFGGEPVDDDQSQDPQMEDVPQRPSDGTTGVTKEKRQPPPTDPAEAREGEAKKENLAARLMRPFRSRR